MKLHTLAIIASTVTLFFQGIFVEGRRYGDRQGDRTPPTCAEAKARYEERSADPGEILQALSEVSCFADKLEGMQARMKEKSERAEERLKELCSDDGDTNTGGRKLRRGFLGGGGGRGFGGGRGDGPPRGEGQGGPPRPDEWECDDYCCAGDVLLVLEDKFGDTIKEISNRQAKMMIGRLTFGIEDYKEENPSCVC